MRRSTKIAWVATTFVIALSAARLTADDPVKANDSGHGEIAVHLKGALSVRASPRPRPDVDPISRSHDEEAYELDSASVTAGGMKVMLDWSQNDEARKDLLWHRVFRHGNMDIVQAEVTGRMVFRPAGEVGGAGSFIDFQAEPPVVVEIEKETPVPVVIVESLVVRLVSGDGRPRGWTPTRPASFTSQIDFLKLSR